MALRVLCVNKTNRASAWERIERIGGINPDGSRWVLSQAEAIAAVKNHTYGELYVERPAGDRVKLIVARSAHGNEYVKTEADGDQPNNLLNLIECPL